MGHAEHDLLHAESAAALDDLLEGGDHRLAAIEPEPLGARVFEVEEFLEAVRLDELVEDRALALAREGDLLVGSLDALLDPGLLGRIGDVHELDADGLAIGALEDGDDLADRPEFEAEHVVEEDLAVAVGFREAVMGGMQLLGVAARLEIERIEIGVEMAAHPVGADQHEGAHRIARRLHDLGRADLGALCPGLRLDLVTDGGLDRGPVAVEGGDELAVGRDRPVRPLPGGAAGVLGDGRGLVLQAGEELAPFRRDGGRVFRVAGVELFDIGGVAAVEKRSLGESFVRVLACHDLSSGAGREGGITGGRLGASGIV